MDFREVPISFGGLHAGFQVSFNGMSEELQNVAWSFKGLRDFRFLRVTKGIPGFLGVFTGFKVSFRGVSVAFQGVFRAFQWVSEEFPCIERTSLAFG